MKKIKILFVFALLEIILFIIAMFLNIKGFALHNVWLSISLLLIGCYAILYGILFKLDSSLYYGSLIIYISFASAFKYIQNFDFKDFYPIYILCFAMAHFTVFVLFRQIIHLKLFAFLLVEGILLIGYKSNIINWWTLVGINALYLCYLLINIIFRVRKNLRRE